MESQDMQEKSTPHMAVHAGVEGVGVGNSVHHDQYAHYTHELSEETSESLSRAVTRLVPLAYGALLGSLDNNLLLGLAASLLVSLALDWSMKEHSMLRKGLCFVTRPACDSAG